MNLLQLNKSATIILVGLKIDLRDNNQNTFITKQEGIANKLKLPKYVECSALTRGRRVILQNIQLIELLFFHRPIN